MLTGRTSKGRTEVQPEASPAYRYEDDRHKGVRQNDLLELVSLLGWHYGYVLVGLSLTKADEGWLVGVKAIRNKTPLIGFVSAPDFSSALLSVGEAIKGGYITWREDAYPTKHTQVLIKA